MPKPLMEGPEGLRVGYHPHPSLLDQSGEWVGYFRIHDLEHRTKLSDGSRYVRVSLDDAQGSVPGIFWSDTLHLAAAIPAMPATVQVTGYLSGHGESRVLRIKQLHFVSNLDLESPQVLLPRRFVPQIAIPSFEALLQWCSALPLPLRQFVGTVLLDPKVTIGFLRCKGSQRHHHAYPGGLLVHSMEMLPLINQISEELRPGDAGNAQQAQIAYLFHDLGKIRTVGERDRPMGAFTPGAVHDPHPAIGLEWLQPALKRLEAVLPEAACTLRETWGYLASPGPRGIPNGPLPTIVQCVDRLSAGGALAQKV